MESKIKISLVGITAPLVDSRPGRGDASTGELAPSIDFSANDFSLRASMSVVVAMK